MNECSDKADGNIDSSEFWRKDKIAFLFLSSSPSTANLRVGDEGEVCEDRQEKDRRMNKEGFQESTMPAGEQANEEAREEDGGHDKGRYLYDIYFCSCVFKCDRESGTFASNKSEATCKEEEDESWREKSSEASLLLRKDPSWSYL